MNHSMRSKGIGALDLLLILAIIGLTIHTFVIVPENNRSATERFRTQELPITVGDRLLAEEYLKKPSPSISPVGTYHGSVEVDGKTVTGIYHFHTDSTISKEITIDVGYGEDYKLTGHAEYSFNGAVMMFTNQTGAKALFSSIGEPIAVYKDRIEVVLL